LSFEKLPQIDWIGPARQSGNQSRPQTAMAAGAIDCWFEKDKAYVTLANTLKFWQNGRE
jgi:hypothetical protein